MDCLLAKKIFILVAAVFVLCLLGNAQVFDCCYSYRKTPVSVKAIKSYTTQRSNEVCPIDAIMYVVINRHWGSLAALRNVGLLVCCCVCKEEGVIGSFRTKKGKVFCADSTDGWVKRAIRILGEKA